MRPHPTLSFMHPTHTPMRFFTQLRAASTAVAMVVLALTAGGCAKPVGQFVWAADYVAREPSAADSKYVVGVGDLINVQVFDNDKVSTRGRVRTDGKLAIPLINDIAVAGKTPVEVGQAVEKALRDGNLILAPRVNVVVEDVPDVMITVLGAVSRAGICKIGPRSGVAEALACAGGLTEFAHKDRIFVLRKVPTPVRIRFTFAGLTDTGPAGAFRLQAGDVVVVE